MHELLYPSILFLRNVEAKARHTTPVLADEISAGVLGIAGVGEEHAFVAGRLLFFADAAGLCDRSAIDWTTKLECASFWRTLTLAAASPWGFTSAAALFGCIAVGDVSGRSSRSRAQSRAPLENLVVAWADMITMLTG